ncbi:hypothetical protein [Streptomyces sp. NPDC001635]
MAATPVRRYLITNPSALFGGGTVIPFSHAAPVGSVVALRVDGRPVRVLLTDTPLAGGVFGAELQIRYL